MSAKMPDHLIKNSRPTLGELQSGSQGFIAFAAVYVDVDRSVYLSSITELTATPEAHSVRVWRDQQGGYHLDLLGRDHKYEPKDLDMEKRYKMLLPVASVTA